MSATASVSMGVYLIVHALDFNAVYGPLKVPKDESPNQYCIGMAAQVGRAFATIFDTSRFTAGTARGKISLNEISFDCVTASTRPTLVGPKWPADK